MEIAESGLEWATIRGGGLEYGRQNPTAKSGLGGLEFPVFRYAAYGLPCLKRFPGQ